MSELAENEEVELVAKRLVAEPCIDRGMTAFQSDALALEICEDLRKLERESGRPAIRKQERERIREALEGEIREFNNEQCLCDPGDPQNEVHPRCFVCYWSDRFRAALDSLEGSS